MNLIKNLPQALHSELLKYKGTKTLLLSIITPLFLASIFFIIYYFKAEKILKEGANGWQEIFEACFTIGINLLFPLFLILLISIIGQQEFKANSFKQTLCYPLPKGSIFISKVIIVQSLVLISLICFFLFTIGVAFLVQIKYPELFHFEAISAIRFLKGLLISYLASTFMMAIQFLLSLNWSSIILAIGTGIAGFISYIILINGWKYIHLHPYSQHILSIKNFDFNSHSEFFNWNVMYSLSCGIGVYLIAYIIMCKKKMGS